MSEEERKCGATNTVRVFAKYTERVVLTAQQRGHNMVRLGILITRKWAESASPMGGKDTMLLSHTRESMNTASLR